MHEKMHLNSNLPLEQLSTEELERLLRTPDGEEPDVDFIMKVMEVIQFREKQTPVTPQLNVDAAWQEFQEEYLNHTVFNTKENDRNVVEKASKHTFKPIPILRRVAILAAVILLFIGTASAFGIFQAVARWTSETFHFGIIRTTNHTIIENDPFEEFREIVAHYTDALIIPTWAPEGTQLMDSIHVIERTNCIDIKGQYQFDEGEFTIYAQIYDQGQDKDGTAIQKDASEPEVIESNGITHYLFYNEGTCVVTWETGNIRCHIQGDLSSEDLSQMITSIYKE